MLTKKDYKAIAEIIREDTQHHYGISTPDHDTDVRMAAISMAGSWIANSLSDYFKQGNPHFDRRKFFKACGI